MSNLDSFLNRIGRAIASIFGGPPPEPPTPGTPPSPAPRPVVEDEPLQPLSPRVLVLNFDPIVDPATGQKLTERMGWNRVDDLIPGYIEDIRDVSGGLLNYQVVIRIDVDDIPVKQDGYHYSVAELIDVLEGRRQAHNPDGVNYRKIVDEHDLISRVMNREIDEVWMFGGPYFGFYESRMVGKGAFWCNAPALENTDHCTRRFVIMGYNYERTVGEMIHDLGHRTESIMTRVFEGKQGDDNLYARFARYDMVAPGRAEVGVVHFPPNAQKDYDWGNPRVVSSKCDDWYNFPNFQGTVKQVSCADWGNGDTRLHHMWWFRHIPHVAGKIGGISNNWWKYIAGVDQPFFDRT